MFVTHPSSDSSSVSVFGTLLYSPLFTPSPPNLLVSSVHYWLFIYEINLFHFWCVSSFGVCLSVTCLFQLLSCSPPLLQMTGSHACWTSSHVLTDTLFLLLLWQNSQPKEPEERRSYLDPSLSECSLDPPACLFLALKGSLKATFICLHSDEL